MRGTLRIGEYDDYDEVSLAVGEPAKLPDGDTVIVAEFLSEEKTSDDGTEQHLESVELIVVSAP